MRSCTTSNLLLVLVAVAWIVPAPATAVPILGVLKAAEDKLELVVTPPTEVNGAELASGFPVVAGLLNFDTTGTFRIDAFAPSSTILGCDDQSSSSSATTASLSFTCLTSPVTAPTVIASMGFSGDGALIARSGSVLFLDGMGKIVEGEAVPKVDVSGELYNTTMDGPSGGPDPAMPEPGAAVLFALGLAATRRVWNQLG